jgi:hypothetical protein
MAIPFTGGCACGAVRYECSVEPMLSVNCHCRDCQQSSGAPFAAVLIVPKAAVSFKGEIKLHQVKADSGNMSTRGFCSTCGSPLFGQPSGLPRELLGLRAVSLDDSSWFRPTMDIYTASAQSWDYMNPDLPKFPKMPPLS